MSRTVNYVEGAGAREPTVTGDALKTIRCLTVCAGIIGLAVPFGSCSQTVATGHVEVLEVFAHDSTAYTQGLELLDGLLIEGTGRYGESTLRRVVPQTGEIVQKLMLDSMYFGEGVSVAGEMVLQLTWQEHVVFVYDAETFDVVDTLDLPTFGWGLCVSGSIAYLTGGGSVLYRRSLPEWDDLGFTEMERNGELLRDVNELECVGGYAYANIYQSDTIVKIDLATGNVVAEFDASMLVPPHLRASPDAVLNGIAYDPASDSFYLTGKLWPVLYRVRMVLD